MEHQEYEFVGAEIAQFLIGCANDRGCFMNITKLQKLLYIAYGMYLAVNGKRLTYEHPEAWPYGPVFKDVRQKFLNCNFDNVTVDTSIFGGDMELQQNIYQLVKSVLDTFGDWSASSLTEWSHQDGSPWSITVNQDSYGSCIPDSLIASYFKNLMKK